MLSRHSDTGHQLIPSFCYKKLSVLIFYCLPFPSIGHLLIRSHYWCMSWEGCLGFANTRTGFNIFFLKSFTLVLQKPIEEYWFSKWTKELTFSIVPYAFQFTKLFIKFNFAFTINQASIQMRTLLNPKNLLHESIWSIFINAYVTKLPNYAIFNMDKSKPNE